MTSSEISVLKNRLLQVTQPDERLFLLKTLATAAYEVNDPEAEEMACEWVALSKQLNNINALCNALRILAEVRIQSMKITPDDEGCVDELIALTLASSLFADLVHAWYLKSTYQLGRSELDEAIHSLHIAKEILDTQINEEDMRYSDLNLDILYQRTSILYRTGTEYADVLLLAMDGLEKSIAVKDIGRQSCFLQLLALITGKMQDFEASIGYINRFIDVEKSQNGHMNLLGAYRLKASMYEQLNDFVAAEKAYTAASEQAKLLNDVLADFYISSKKIPVLINDNRLEEAKILAIELLSLINNKSVVKSEAEIYFYLADIAQRQNNPQAAVTILEKNKQLFLERDDKVLLQNITALLHSAYHQCGDDTNAYKALIEHQALTKNIYATEKSKEYAQLHTRFETKQKEAQLKQLQIDNLNSELRLLKSQMNPHFMFNAIGSVSNLMQSGRVDEAQDSLRKFSRLMRSTLEQSQGDDILLEDEIDFLENYLHLEKLILADNFSFKISVDDSIDVAYERIPSLILQPIVENALKHGLRTKQGERKLNISFTLEEKEEQTTMQITIEDNGIGRKASAELNKDRKQHQSFATKSIDNRIKIINTTAGFGKMKMETMDVMEDSVALGTKVQLSIIQG